MADHNLGIIEEFRANAGRVGGQLTWVAVQALADAATTIRETGDLEVLSTQLEPDRWLG